MGACLPGSSEGPLKADGRGCCLTSSPGPHHLQGWTFFIRELIEVARADDTRLPLTWAPPQISSILGALDTLGYRCHDEAFIEELLAAARGAASRNYGRFYAYYLPEIVRSAARIRASGLQGLLRAISTHLLLELLATDLQVTLDAVAYADALLPQQQTGLDSAVRREVNGCIDTLVRLARGLSRQEIASFVLTLVAVGRARAAEAVSGAAAGEAAVEAAGGDSHWDQLAGRAVEASSQEEAKEVMKQALEALKEQHRALSQQAVKEEVREAEGS